MSSFCTAKATHIFSAKNSYSHFFSKKFQNICVSLDVNFNESLTNDVVSFEQLGPECTGEHSSWLVSLPFAYDYLGNVERDVKH